MLARSFRAGCHHRQTAGVARVSGFVCRADAAPGAGVAGAARRPTARNRRARMMNKTEEDHEDRRMKRAPQTKQNRGRGRLKTCCLDCAPRRATAARRPGCVRRLASKSPMKRRKQGTLRARSPANPPPHATFPSAVSIRTGRASESHGCSRGDALESRVPESRLDSSMGPLMASTPFGQPGTVMRVAIWSAADTLHRSSAPASSLSRSPCSMAHAELVC